jgi:tellurite resistance protein TerC
VDVASALDSLPAIFAVTRSSFVVYTSNVFDILGLRASFFLLAGLMPRLHDPSLVVVLVPGAAVGASLLVLSAPAPFHGMHGAGSNGGPRSAAP